MDLKVFVVVLFLFVFCVKFDSGGVQKVPKYSSLFFKFFRPVGIGIFCRHQD
jgi:hypothetical protein